MADIVDKKTRSRMMSGIRSKNTKPEILTRSELHKLGYRYCLESKIQVKSQKRKIKPDIVLRKYKVALFVNSCFFHQHQNCKLAYSDREYTEFWLDKFKKNKERDARVLKQLLDEGWRIAIIWECGTRNKNEFKKIISQVNYFIQSNNKKVYESAYTLR